MIRISRALMIPALMTAALRVRAFDPGKAGWKMTADGKSIDMKDGNPIWVDANGGESVMQGDTITRLNGEARTLRQQKEAAEAVAAAFKDIDPAKAKAALDTVSKLDHKKLIDAGEVDRVKEEIKTQYTGQISELTNKLTEVTGTLDNVRVDNFFANSEFIRNNIAVPSDMFQATFRNNFKIKDGKIEAYGKDGNRVYSSAKVGEFADPEEAIQLIVAQHPQKDVILKAPNQSGGGGSNNSGRLGKREMKRSEFEKLHPGDAAATAGKVRSGEIILVD
jgi:hypothetical protein